MNVHTQPQKPILERLRPVRSDQEFLPAAISILETPPSPVRVVLIWTISLLAAVAIGWSYFGRIDIIAIAQGKIQPTGRVKTVQPVEPGRVTAIFVENGKRVAAGQPLIELDPAEARAEEAASNDAVIGYKAERARRRIALEAAAGREIGNIKNATWPGDLPDDARRRQERVLKGDLDQLATSVRSIDAQARQKEAEAERLGAMIIAETALITTLRERVAMRSELAKKGATARSSVIDALESLQYQETTLATQKGQLSEAKAAIGVLKEEREKSFDAFAADNNQKLAEAERLLDEAQQRLAKARARLSHTTITSPIDGSVLGLSITTIGQVVGASEEMMRIVPVGTGLEIECYVQNKDSGFVKPGQTAVVKIESFPFTRYGTIDGTVQRIAHDAIPEPDAQTAEANPAKATKSSYFGGAQRTQNLVFPVTLQPDRTTINIDGTNIALTPGMAVSVEIKTGSRRILEYIFSPLVETSSRAMKER